MIESDFQHKETKAPTHLYLVCATRDYNIATENESNSSNYI